MPRWPQKKTEETANEPISNEMLGISDVTAPVPALDLGTLAARITEMETKQDKQLTIKEHFHAILRVVEDVSAKTPDNKTLSNGVLMLKNQVMPIIECGLREVGHKE